MANDLNLFLERARGKVLNDYKEILLNNHRITSEVLKRKFLGLDENSKTSLELIDYHNENMQQTLSWGTLKNYKSTRRYDEKFIREYKRSAPVYLSELNYQFIVEFENFIRLHPLKENDPLHNNGLMKRIERLKKNNQPRIPIGLDKKIPV